jgi:hypothetical protein
MGKTLPLVFILLFSTMISRAQCTPTISIVASPKDTICVGNGVNFIATINNGGSSPSYQWKLNGSNVGTNNSVYYNGSLSNNDTVRCVLTSNASCANPVTAVSNNIRMTVHQYDTPTISISANPGDTICAGTSVTFTATITHGGPSPVYQWKLNGNNVGTNTNTYTNSSLSHGNAITCELTSSVPCPAQPSVLSTPINMKVYPMVTPTINISVSPATTICAGTIASFTASTTHGGSNPVLQWKLNSNNVGINDSAYSNGSLANGDVIRCELTSNALCATTTSAMSGPIPMTIKPLITSAASISANPDTNITNGVTVTFTATTNMPSPTYQWTRNGNFLTGEIYSTYISNLFNDTDKIMVIVQTTDSCTNPKTVYSNTLTMHLPNKIEHETLLTDFHIVPNPNNGNFRIQGQFNSDSNARIEVLNIYGALLFSKEIGPYNTLDIPIVLSDKLTNGIYLLSVNTAKSSHTIRFSVVH